MLLTDAILSYSYNSNIRPRSYNIILACLSDFSKLQREAHAGQAVKLLSMVKSRYNKYSYPIYQNVPDHFQLMEAGFKWGFWSPCTIELRRRYPSSRKGRATTRHRPTVGRTAWEVPFTDSDLQRQVPVPPHPLLPPDLQPHLNPPLWLRVGITSLHLHPYR